MSSAAHSYASQCPTTGSTKRGSKSWPYAVTRVKKRAPKATKTHQCAAPTHGRCSIRVCPRVSTSIVRQRRPGESLRWAGPPSDTTATMVRTARTKSATPTTEMVSASTRAATTATSASSAMGGMLLVSNLCGAARRGRWTRTRSPPAARPTPVRLVRGARGAPGKATGIVGSPR